MKTNLLTAAIAATAIVGLSGAALAQATGPAAQDTTKMNKDMSKDSMSKDGMKGSNSNMAPTTSGANTSPSQKPMTTPAEPKGKESNSESPKR
jgi:pentapeptide MXKDX repeat protein